MKTKTLLPVFLLLLIISSCSKTEFTDATSTSTANLSAKTLSKPNIILILGDDVGYEIPNYTGGQSYSTPNLNYLAANGTQFTQCYTSPLCSPSRIMMITGKYNFRNYTTWGRLDTTQRTIANILEDAGYATCVAGKWQFDGGDASIHKFGFQKYLVTNHRHIEAEDDSKDIYKNPTVIYENGALWPADSGKGKYGEDIIRDYMFKFIDSNKNQKPFFVYWSMNLIHPPLCPTPDDPQYAAWNPNKKPTLADTMYFPSMVKYADKLIGQLINKLKTDGLESNTVILYSGDNGTLNGKHSLWNGQIVVGGKATTTGAGTHVPLVAYWPGHVLAGATDTSLISHVDFMSTIATIANATIPSSYGITDGITFAPQFLGDYSNVRPWVFCHYVGAAKNEIDPLALKRWMQNQTYKQYDSLPNRGFSKKFYNIKLDPLEKNPIATGKMTPQEKIISKQYLNTMKQLH